MPPGGGVPVQPGAAGIPGTGAPMPPGGGVPVQPGAAGIPVAGAAIPAWMSEASQGGVPVQMGAASLQALGAAMTPLMNKAEQSEAVNVVSINFDRIIERVMANVPATKFVDEYLKGIDALPESVRRTISGGGDSKDAMIGRIPLGMRGRLLALDLSQGATDLMRLRQEMERIAPSPGEFVQLLEIVSRLVKESAESPEDAEKKLKSVLDLLPLSGEAKVERLSLLLMIPDRGELEAYAAALEQAGYAVTACRQPDFNIAALLQARVFDAMIIGVYPYQLTQLAFLKSPPEGTTFPPLFYVDDVTRIRSRKEMDFIPEGRFIYKPLSPDELVKVLTNDVPVTGEVVPPPDAGEVARAIQIQHELSPRELPVIPEYSIAARFEPGQAHGGNYHDVVSLPGRRFGILLMDVTGSRAAGTLALAAARANFRTISRQSGNAVETLVAMNNLLAGEIPRGTFVRAMYGVLDPKQGKLTVAGGGLPRPLRWNDDAPGIRALQVTGPPLGLTRGKVFEETLKTATVTLEPGDHVAFCTLAVTRSVNDQNKMLGERGVALAMQPSLKGPAGLALVEIVEAVRTHRGDEAPDADDFTVLELRREP